MFFPCRRKLSLWRTKQALRSLTISAKKGLLRAETKPISALRIQPIQKSMEKTERSEFKQR